MCWRRWRLPACWVQPSYICSLTAQFIHLLVRSFIGLFWETPGQIPFSRPDSPNTYDPTTVIFPLWETSETNKWDHCDCIKDALTCFQRILTMTATQRIYDAFKIPVKTPLVSKWGTCSPNLLPMRWRILPKRSQPSIHNTFLLKTARICTLWAWLWL